jgi:competence protein ComEC
MNNFIEYMASYPFSIVDAIQIDLTQTVIIYSIICGLAYFIFEKRRIGFHISLCGLLFFLILRASSFRQASLQRRIIVYDIPKHTAIDMADGRSYIFLADASLSSNEPLQRLHIKPNRIEMRLSKREPVRYKMVNPLVIKFYDRKIAIVESNLPNFKNKLAVDLLIISGNPNILIGDIERSFSYRFLVFDSSNAAWKLKKWKRECEKSALRYYSVVDSGAFVMNVD